MILTVSIKGFLNHFQPKHMLAYDDVKGENYMTIWPSA